MMRGLQRDQGDPVRGLNIFSQNVRRNALHVDMLLSSLSGQYDIVFLQEPPWNTVRMAPSAVDVAGEAVTGGPMHPDWLYLARQPRRGERPPRVMTYVAKRLAHLRPSLRLDLLNSPDVVWLELFVQGTPIFG